MALKKSVSAGCSDERAVMNDRKKYDVRLVQKDIEVILEALGILHNINRNKKIGTKPIDIVFDKIYRALGVEI